MRWRLPGHCDLAARDHKRHLKVERGLAPASVNQALAGMDHLFRFLGLGAAIVGREALPRSAPRALDVEQLRALLRAAEESTVRDRAIVALLLFTGLRLSEAAALQVSDVRVSARKGLVVVRSGKGDAYEFGAKFVATLIKKADGYELVDEAWRSKLPETTEQIIHPKKYLSGEQAREVRPPDATVLGGGWKASGVQPFGELDALAVLSTKTLPKGAAGKARAQAVEGWDGGARALFTRGDDRALAIATTWESAKDAKEFASAYERSLKKERGGTASGDAVEIADVGFATVAANGRDVTFAIAPDANLATKLAGG